MLAYEYLDRDDLVHVKDADHVPADAPSAERELSAVRVTGSLPPAPSGRGGAEAPVLTTNGNAAQALNGIKINGTAMNGHVSIAATKPVVSSPFWGGREGAGHAHGSMAEAKADVKKMMGTSADAPACSNCGNITLRNGTCYMCPNCGTTTGCS